MNGIIIIRKKHNTPNNSDLITFISDSSVFNPLVPDKNIKIKLKPTALQICFILLVKIYLNPTSKKNV